MGQPLNPSNARGFFRLGQSYWTAGDYEQAVVHHSEAIQLDSEAVEYLFHRAQTYT